MSKELCLKCGARAVAHDAQGDPYCEGHGGRALLEQPTLTPEQRDEIAWECRATPDILATNKWFEADPARIAAYTDAQVVRALEEAERAIVESASRYNSSGYTASKTWVLIGFGYAQGAVRALLAARRERKA